MAYTTIDDPSAYFQTLLYTGDDNNNRALTNTGNSDLQPDWVWIKNRTGATKSHQLVDSSRGVTKYISTDGNNEESTHTNRLDSFDSDGFTTDNHSSVNESSRTYVAWQWKANGGTTTTNDASATGVGDIDSVYQANTTSGFSIVTHTGSGSAGNIAHGLGAVPEWVVTKNRTDDNQSWANYHVGVGNAYYLELDTTDAKETASSVWGDTTPSSTTFRVGGANGKNNASSKNYVTYCFTPIQGYSKFGSYKGNGDENGPMVYCGFKPAWLLLKNTTDNGDDWHLFDTKRDPINRASQRLKTNDNSAEASDGALDFLSNGFKLRNTSNARNGNGDTIIFIAFASSPFVGSDGTPCTAR